MSVYYELVCHDHKARVDACSRSVGAFGANHVGTSHEKLGPFMVAHCGCRLEVVSELDDRMEWPDGEMSEWERF